jgi:hypothetical protein
MSAIDWPSASVELQYHVRVPLKGATCSCAVVPMAINSAIGSIAMATGPEREGRQAPWLRA